MPLQGITNLPLENIGDTRAACDDKKGTDDMTHEANFWDQIFWLAEKWDKTGEQQIGQMEAA